MARAQLQESDVSQFWAIMKKIERLENERPEELHRTGATGEPAFANAWVNFSANRPAGFYRHNGRTYLEGMIKSGTITATAFTLPSVYWPPIPSGEFRVFSVVSNDVFGELLVAGDGRIIPNAGSNLFFFLDGISFRHA